jgi:hypothetical protein
MHTEDAAKLFAFDTYWLHAQLDYVDDVKLFCNQFNDSLKSEDHARKQKYCKEAKVLQGSKSTARKQKYKDTQARQLETLT